MKRIHTLTAAAALGALLAGTASQAYAQGTDELAFISRYNFGISSARSAGMGGAFTSLGADPATLSMNPAGIAMYRTGEVSFSPGLRINVRNSDYRGAQGNPSYKDNLTKPNISSAAVIYAGENYALGFGINRLADFNSTSRAFGYGEGFSIGDMFAEQLNGIPNANLAGVNSNGNAIYDAFYNYPPALWGAILGYQTGAVDPVEGVDGQYTTNSLLYPGAQLSPGWVRKTKGAINEYTISGGYNFNDVLYLGASLGIQDIYYTRHDTYDELAPDDNFGLDQIVYNQNLQLSGTGVNFKIGATVRPVNWLRIGLAYHTPTWVSMSEQYDADMTVWDFRFPKESFYSDTPFLRQDYDLRTPSRLLAGISAQIGTYGIISVDYEHVWYKSMKYSDNDFSDVNRDVKNIYKGGNNLRVGAEFQPITSFFVRAGYGYSGSIYQNSDYKDWGKYEQFSFGLGYRRGIFNIDLAYVHGTTWQAPYKPFSYTASDGYYVGTEGTIYTKEKNHNLILTLAFKF